MSTAAIVDNMLASVRTLLKQHPPFASMSRLELDVLLGDVERVLLQDLDDLDEQHEREIALEIQWAREDWEAERREAVKAAKSKKVKPNSREIAP
jgi:hypothetical protein